MRVAAGAGFFAAASIGFPGFWVAALGAEAFFALAAGLVAIGRLAAELLNISTELCLTPRGKHTAARRHPARALSRSTPQIEVQQAAMRQQEVMRQGHSLGRGAG
jgi:hypothetical protein